LANTAWVRTRLFQLLAHGRWFSPGTPASSTTKTGRHDIAENNELMMNIHKQNEKEN
jgi:hypothetical protein